MFSLINVTFNSLLHLPTIKAEPFEFHNVLDENYAVGTWVIQWNSQDYWDRLDSMTIVSEKGKNNCGFDSLRNDMVFLS